ncbi:hypothetical protein [Burkholderia gladioli]|uniref:hypothetical protein n=1 Tax=Burkholderia gladioli TaxID=28095 RepID=UPI00163EF5F6|nr:hypothetical protein [Burkholderia gladioli]
MKNTASFAALWMVSGVCVAAVGSSPIIQSLRVSDRLVYLGSDLAGVYSVCAVNNSSTYYFLDSFFKETRLRRSNISVECEGQTYWKPVIEFVRGGDTDGGLKASPSMDDYEHSTESSDEGEAVSDELGQPQGDLSYASMFQHQGSLWRNATGSIDATGSLAGRQYTPYGLFSIESYVSSTGGQFQGYLSDASWKKNYPEYGVAATLGVNTFGTSGAATTLYGLVLGSNEDSIRASTTQTIDGFAEVPGRIQIRSGNLLIKEVPVTAGFFQIPAAGLPTPAGTNGQYTLTLVDAAGRPVKTWDVFLPAGSSLLKAGASTWKVFVGHVETSATRSSLISGRRNLGTGVVYRRGVTSKFTLEMSGIAAEKSAGAGVSGEYDPLSWLSLNGGASRYTGELRSTSTFGGADVHFAYIGLYSGFTRQSCNGVYQSALGTTQCSNIRNNLYLTVPYLGRLSLLRTATIGGGTGSESLGFSWSPPNFGRVNWSVYGNRESYSGSKPTYSVGLVATIPIGRGSLMNTATFSGNSVSNSSTYSVSDEQNNQFSLGADVTHSATNTVGSLRASAGYNPWFGSYQANTTATSSGDVSVGVSESGSLVSINRQVLPMRSTSQSLSIIRLPSLPNVELVDGNGNTQGRTNANGYAVVPATREGWTSLKVSPDEIPDGYQVRTNLVGKVSDDWSAVRWEPVVRRVNHGWARIALTDGAYVPMGSMLQFKGEDADYVLGKGEVFFENLPVEPGSVELRYPGDAGRCVVKLPGNVKLNQNYTETMPTFVCYSPAQYRSEYEGQDSKTGSVSSDGNR